MKFHKSVKAKSLYPTILLAITALLLHGCANTGKQVNLEPSYPSDTIAHGTYEMPPAGNDIVGKSFKISAEQGDTFTAIAKRYDMGLKELIAANPHINPRRMSIGSKITVPQEYILPPKKYRKGIVINTAELRLYYFTKNNTVMTFPISIGREGWATPLGNTYVYRKQEKPTWWVPKSVRDEYLTKTGEEHPRKVEPGPKNPLGDYAIYLHMKGYLIHGTNNPASIGRLVSSGCVRMFNHDVKELFQHVKRGTPVNILYYPNKVGYRDGNLYMESHKPLFQHEVHYTANQISMEKAMEAMTGHEQMNINYKKAQHVMDKFTGIPTYIG